MNIKQAQKLIFSWHEPYKTYANGHIIDAIRDIKNWPSLRYKILKDMEDCIKQWEIIENNYKLKLQDLSEYEKLQ